ncbi:hypothetical protein C5167_050274 [Papaver somniferum]|uniref:Protein kinase domain-containing protein n=1 Tax=Papaver somniferum TaxID=3469 RepID=A0A4Y7KRL9_PAPSO|nr:hypothetical protein C5167_050274 [Papaver somniferum]
MAAVATTIGFQLKDKQSTISSPFLGRKLEMKYPFQPMQQRMISNLKDDFMLGKKLGEGAFGVVYRVSLAEKPVLKSSSKKGGEYWLVWRFEGEATLQDLMLSKEFPYNVGVSHMLPF